MRVNLHDIQIGSRCFRQLAFLKESDLIEPANDNLTVVRQVVNKMHALELESGWKIGWRRLMDMVNKKVFNDVDVESKETFLLAKQRADHILNFLKIWYEGTYKPDQRSCYPGLTLEKSIGNHVIWDTIPVIKIDEIPMVSAIVDGSRKPGELYNDIVARGRAMLVMNELECSEIIYEEFCYGPRGGLIQTDINIHQSRQSNFETALLQIADIISADGRFPSFGDHCKSCVFRNSCVL